MLVLGRKLNEDIVIRTDGPAVIRLRPVDFRRGKVRLGFDADDSVRIDRDEIDRQRNPDQPTPRAA